MTDPTPQALPDGRSLKYSIFHEAFWWAALPAAAERRSRLERAAEVLYVQGVSESGLTPAWDRQPDHVRQNWMRRARVVLDAAEKDAAA